MSLFRNRNPAKWLKPFAFPLTPQNGGTINKNRLTWSSRRRAVEGPRQSLEEGCFSLAGLVFVGDPRNGRLSLWFENQPERVRHVDQVTCTPTCTSALSCRLASQVGRRRDYCLCSTSPRNPGRQLCAVSGPHDCQFMFVCAWYIF